jgi:hypothetical protein
VITSGSLHDLTSADTLLAILDVGFARQRRSCGLVLPNSKPQCLTFGEATQCIITFVSTASSPVNLVIEAPLSVAFTHDGNPTGRTVESQNGLNRYWYVGLGTSVMVAALYLIKALPAGSGAPPVRLFEGFVSFKRAASDHLADVRALEHVIRTPRLYPSHIVAPEGLRASPTDSVQSAGQLCGIDFGIPYVISDRRLTRRAADFASLRSLAADAHG